MSQPIKPGSSTEVKSSENKLPESPSAYQKPSQGPLLKASPRGFGGWFLYIITFQWVAALFTTTEEKIATPQIDTRTHQANVKQLLDRAQSLLAGRIPTKEQQEIQEWLLNQASPQWLAGFAAFLNEADRLDAKKPDHFPLALSEETDRLTNELHPALLSEVTESKVMANLLMEIVFLTTVNNTQMIGYTLTPDERSKPYLISIYSSHPSFALQFEIRTDQKTLLITDPLTKSTRSVKFDPEQSEQEHQLQLAKAIYDLSHPTVVGGGSTPKSLREWITAGNLYEISIGNTFDLSLSPRSVDLPSTGLERGTISQARKVIAGGNPGIITMPILLGPKENIDVKPEIVDRFCIVTFTYKNQTYQTRYPLKEDEKLPALAMRINLDRTLERDLLLARSFFARNLS